MTTRLEHANLQVRDIDGMIEFLRTAFPDFELRHDSGKADPERWVHVGNDDSYVALNVATQRATAPRQPYSGTPGFNHLGFVVDDVEALRERLLAAGYGESTMPNYHPARIRVYFNDHEGNDWEFVQYLSEDPRERHDYSE